MKRKRFSIEQIVAVLKQAEMGVPDAVNAEEPAHQRRNCAKSRFDGRL